MRNIILGILIVAFAITSCSRDDDSLQRIDQVLNVYINSSTNPDLLNAKKKGSYTSYSVNDVFGSRDNSPVIIPLKMTQDSLFYMEYIAGAKRRRMDSISPDNPGTGTSFFSRMDIAFTRKKDDNTTEQIVDRLEVQYRMSSSLFQVSKVLYNGVEKFSKEENAPTSINVVTITK